MQNPEKYWLGEPAEKSVMLEHFTRAFMNHERSGLHYLHTYPGENRSAESLYTLRICKFEAAGTLPEIHAAFDGIPSVRTVQPHDILLGSYNGSNQVLNSAQTLHGGVSIIFHTHHIRLHYCRFEYGKPVVNLYYYAPAASGTLLHMARALDSLIHTPFDGRNECCHALLEALVRQLHHELLNTPEELAPEINPLANKLKYFIEQNFYRMINCSTICEELNLNRSYASKLFHDSHGITMNNYLLNLRLEAAKNLLKSEENVKISEISRQCAFHDPGYFIRIFRQHCSCTPGEFRRQDPRDKHKLH